MVRRDGKICGSGRSSLKDSYCELWHGQRSPPLHQGPTSRIAYSGRKLGVQLKWVQISTTTKISGRMDRCQFLAYSGCCEATEVESLSCPSSARMFSNISGLRWTIITGRLRQATTFIWPGSRSEIST